MKKMRIVFINPMLRPDSKRRMLPVGLAYVMTAVKRAGIDFDLIDMDINSLSVTDFEDILSSKPYDIYCAGCIVTGYKIIKEIAQIIKRVNPNSIIIAGNSVAKSIPEILLKNTKVDIGIMGEADITIIELLNSIEKKRSLVDVKGIVFKKNNEIIYTPKRAVLSNLDSIGFPDWDIFELHKYDKYGKINLNYSNSNNIISYPLNSARGCPFNCTFCYHVFKNEKYRKYSEEKIIDEIKRLKNKYDCNFIDFWDELTFLNIRAVQKRLEELAKLDFFVSWSASIRGNLFKKEHMELIRGLKEYGCESVGFSLENASPEILTAINKKLNLAEFVEQTKALWEGGVVPQTSVIFGYPQETPETIQATIDVCEECNLFPSVGFLLPLPGTEIYKWAVENRYIIDETEYLERIGDRQDFHINLTGMPDKEFVETVTEKLEILAKKQGLKLDNVFKTTTYQTPKIKR